VQDSPRRRHWSPLLAALAALAFGLGIGFIMGSTTASGGTHPVTVVTRTVPPPTMPPYEPAQAAPVPVVSGNG